MKKFIIVFSICLSCIIHLSAQTSTTYILKPDRIFNGTQMHANWCVVVTGKRIVSAGESATIQVPADAKVIDMKGMTLMPG